MELVLHPHTEQQIKRLIDKPAHAVLLSGPSGIGKLALAKHLAEKLLGLKDGSLLKYPHIRIIAPTEGRMLGIDTVRDLEHFLSLQVPGNRQVARVAIIEDSHVLTLEAQNALLKTLEEPPKDTVLILTAVQEYGLLPTIRSRLHTVTVGKPQESALFAYFSDAEPEDLKQALTISGGLPGLTSALLDSDSQHPLMEAVRYSRELLQKTAFERLLMVDELAKRKDLARDICYVLGHMAQLALANTANPRWQVIMKAAYEAAEALANSAQPKLVLTNLMLQL